MTYNDLVKRTKERKMAQTLRNLDPVIWGRKGWNTFAGLTFFDKDGSLPKEKENKEKEKEDAHVQRWKEIILECPLHIPCLECAQEAEKYLTSQHLALSSVTTINQCRAFLEQFVSAVHQRLQQESFKSLTQELKFHLSRHNVGDQPLVKRFDYQPLWLMDAYFFFYCCMAVSDDLARTQAWIQKCDTLILEISEGRGSLFNFKAKIASRSALWQFPNTVSLSEQLAQKLKDRAIVPRCPNVFILTRLLHVAGKVQLQRVFAAAQKALAV
jgi:hypothetical protein